MAHIKIINASPRAPRSNSKIYAKMFADYCTMQTEYLELNRKNAPELAQSASDCKDLILVFPLYADGIPVSLLNFLKELSQIPSDCKPTVSAIINCGFLESMQNNIAVEQIRLFCDENGFSAGSFLKIGSGEAIADTPFKVFVKYKMKRFAKSVEKGNYWEFSVSMPLTKKMFVIAANKYWLNRGKQNGLTKEQMDVDLIEDQ